MVEAEDSDLGRLGWNPFFEDNFAAHEAQGLVPARVTLEHNYLFRVHTGRAEVLAVAAGRLKRREHGSPYPAVGDWVAVEPVAKQRRAVIEAVLPRRSRFSRKVAGEVTREQVVAANVDTVFLTQGLDDDFNVRRMERALVMVRDSGAEPVILLNKSDLVADVETRVTQMRAAAPGVAVIAVSAVQAKGLEELASYIGPGRTVALIGSSGVGKSTLVNSLAGSELLRTAAVRQKGSQGRHTTTHRQLVLLPSGGMVIDTPGLRELQLWEVGTSIEETFRDIEDLAAGCRFRDCRHENEPRCAVTQAVAEERLGRSRLESYRKLRKEAAAISRKQDELAALTEKRRVRAIHRQARLHRREE
jgi:ribosome biogenesis GTPase / thiamine phosphate phosphatase